MHISVVEKKMETETIVTACSKTIKYELDVKELTPIPSKSVELPAEKSSIETVISPDITEPCMNASATSDVPPKPPPRNFPPTSLPSDSTKAKTTNEVCKLNPVVDHTRNTAENITQQVENDQKCSDQTKLPNHTNTHGNNKTTESVSQLQQIKDVETSSKTFEPKVVSTPLPKQEKTEFAATDTPIVKNVVNIDTFKSVSEAKMSPTNSVVMAMIYSNKNKTGSKKKNSLMASK